MAVTLVTQYDIDRVKNIESNISRSIHLLCMIVDRHAIHLSHLDLTDTTLMEYEMKEEEVLKQLNLVTISKREMELVSHFDSV